MSKEDTQLLREIRNLLREGMNVKPKQMPHSGTCADVEATLVETVRKLRDLEAELAAVRKAEKEWHRDEKRLREEFKVRAEKPEAEAEELVHHSPTPPRIESVAISTNTNWCDRCRQWTYKKHLHSQNP